MHQNIEFTKTITNKVYPIACITIHSLFLFDNIPQAAPLSYCTSGCLSCIFDMAFTKSILVRERMGFRGKEFQSRYVWSVRLWFIGLMLVQYITSFKTSWNLGYDIITYSDNTGQCCNMRYYNPIDNWNNMWVERVLHSAYFIVRT